MKISSKYLILLSFLFTSNIFAQIKLPSIFSDNMILQQQTYAAIWGWSGSKAKIIVITSWDGKKYYCNANDEGNWKTYINTPSAGGPYEISVSDSKSKILIKNILIGEVWLCAGQSNMEMPMKGFIGQPVLGSNGAIVKSKNKNIRILTVPRSAKTIPQNNFNGSWKEANPESISEFSAVAYYFGRLINEVLDIPVGLINISYGGSCIEAWMSKNSSCQFENIPIPDINDTIKIPNRTPTALFNGMLSPVIGFNIKGCIWYQGESNYKYPDKYSQLLLSMVSEWRKLWNIGEFPFYFAQIAPYNYKLLSPDEINEKWNSAYLRESQLKAQKIIPNSGIVILLDAGDEKNIHPSDKEVVGERFAYLALAKTYNIKGIGYESPVYKGIEIKDTSIIVSFDNVTNGLTSFGKNLENFEIAGEDRIFYPAKANLRRKSVEVYSSKVRKPVAVRYAFKDFVEATLFCPCGLPVSSFRSDEW